MYGYTSFWIQLKKIFLGAKAVDILQSKEERKFWDDLKEYKR